MLNAGFNVGQAVGPVLGSLIYDLTGFRTTMNVMAAISALTGVLYFVAAGGCKAIEETRKNFNERKSGYSDDLSENQPMAVY